MIGRWIWKWIHKERKLIRDLYLLADWTPSRSALLSTKIPPRVFTLPKLKSRSIFEEKKIQNWIKFINYKTWFCDWLLFSFMHFASRTWCRHKIARINVIPGWSWHLQKANCPFVDAVDCVVNLDCGRRGHFILGYHNAKQTSVNVPGTIAFTSTIVAPPGGTNCVWMPWEGASRRPPSR